MAKKTITMDGDKVCIAWFRKKKVNLTTSVNPVGSGTITAGGVHDKGSVVTVEAIATENNEFDHFEVNGEEVDPDDELPNKWSGLGMNIMPVPDILDCVDTLLANGFKDIRLYPIDFGNTEWIDEYKATVLAIIAKGAKVTWGLTGDETKITTENWATYRQAVLDLAQWCQDNGVYEFQIGNEEGKHLAGTITIAQLITNLKSLATEVKAIFTNGKVIYACDTSFLSNWISAGKGDIDIFASNIYMGGNGSYGDIWKTEITDMVNAFGVDGTCITEFAPSWSSIEDYSTDEAVQATGVAEMIDYIKASGITKAIFFDWKEIWDMKFGVIKADGTCRQLWNSLLNSE